jgi:ATP-binding protein involved in chromosome partitioning
VSVPVLGIVENMSYFVCPHCGGRTDVFGHGGGRAEAERLGVPFLGEIPLDPAVRDAGDRGTPIVVANPSSPQTAAFAEIASRLLASLGASLPDRSAKPGRVFSRFRRG